MPTTRIARPSLGLGARVRRHVGAAITDGFFFGAATSARWLPIAQPIVHGVRVERNIAYRDTGKTQHTLDLYRPRKASSGPLPIVLYFHGGGFRFMSKDTHWVFGLVYARRGYLVVNVNYHLAPDRPFPAAVEDASAVWQWLVQNAERIGGDLSRVVVAGESAGANLSAALTLMTHTRRPESFAREAFDTKVTPKAVVAACGIFDVSHPERFSDHHVYFRDRVDEVADAYLHGAEFEHEHTLDLADPLRGFERLSTTERPLPPFFLPCGTWDMLLDDSRRLAVELRRLGSKNTEAREYPRGPHAFHAFVLTPSALRCWKDTFAFLDAHV
ncbi:MAG: alpha/beta hydrolase [Archangium sp.]